MFKEYWFFTKNMSYTIIRFYKSGKKREIIKRGLTLKEAQEHCSRDNTRKEGVWFDGYQNE